ncbi:MAG: DNA primase, partial [Chromatiaceae bacterium]|nr:DNA primase [Chromatiaceae bacterium]
ANSGRRPATSPLRLAIALLIQHPELASALTGLGQDWHQLNNPGIRLLERIIATLATQIGLGSAALLERWRDEEDFKILIQLSDPRLLAHIPTEGLEPELSGAIQRLNQEALTTRSGNLFNRASPGEWTEEEKAALRQAVQPSQG